MADPARAERLEHARRGYDALVRGDLEAVMEGMADSVEWRNPPDAIEGGTRRGRDAFAAALRVLIEPIEYRSVEILDSAEIGDAIALRVRTLTRGRGSGLEMDTVFGHVMRFEDDEQVALEWYNRPEHALQAIGAAEWASAPPGGS